MQSLATALGGKRSGSGRVLDTILDAPNRVQLRALSPGPEVGISVAAADEANGDGIDDILVGDDHANSEAGGVCLAIGSTFVDFVFIQFFSQGCAVHA